MVDPATVELWRQRALFGLVCCLVIFVQLLPLRTVPSPIPGPDLLFAVTAIWIIRRPSHAPLLMIAILHFATDILFLRPLGLWSAISIFGYEYLRNKATGPSDIPFPLEFLTISGTFAVMMIVNSLAHLVLLMDQSTTALQALHVLTTVAAYPLVLIFCYFVVGIHHPKPGEFDGHGAAL